MTLPSQLPEWATAPSDPPNDIIDPGAAVKAEGWDPDQRPPAGWMNYWQNLVYLWIKALAFSALKSWTLFRDISPTTPQEFQWLGHDYSTGVLVVTGDTGNDATFRSMNGGETWIAPTTPPIAIADCSACASDNAGNWVIGGHSPSISESSDDGDTWTTRVMGAANDRASRCVYDAFNGLWIITGDNFLGVGVGRRIWTSPDRINWTARLSDVSTQFMGDIWVNAAGFSVALSNGNLYYTSPDGINWTARTVTGATSLNGVVYSEGAGLWMITGTDGARVIYTSTDGITFTEPAGSTVPNLALNNINSDQGGLFVIEGSSSSAEGLIYVSVDQGVTWEQVTGWDPGMAHGPGEAQPTPTGQGSINQGLHFFAQRFMTVDHAGNFWRSDAV